jgi:Flp pilus assembly protein TadD
MAKKKLSATPRRNSMTAHGPSQLASIVEWFSSHEVLGFLILSSIWVFCLYGRSLAAPFVYDDIEQIASNPSLASWHSFVSHFLLAPVAFTNDFRGTGGSSYRPVYWLSLALDRKLWGLDPSGFHLTNLLLHIADGLLGFALLRRLRLSLLLSAATMLVWLSLPINTEVVAWISGRAYSLSFLFLLLALLAAERQIRKGGILSLLAYFAASCCALLSHEQGLLLLPLTLLVAYAIDRTPQLSWLKLSAIAIVTDVTYFLLKQTIGTQSAAGSGSVWPVGLFFWKYLQWLILPIHMSLERSTSTPTNAASSAAMLASVALLLLIALIFFLRENQPVVAAGLMWMTVAIAPFCGLVFLYQGMAERFVYVASAGFVLAVATLAIEYRHKAKGLSLGLLLLWTGWGAWRLCTRVQDWRDPVALYRNSLKATPNSPKLLYNLGIVLRDRGELEEAEQANRAALALRPDDPNTVFNLAVVLQQAGKTAAAEQEFQHAIALAPHESRAYTDLGVLFYQQGRPNDAVKMFAKAIDNKSSDPTPYYNLAALLQQSGRDDLALLLYKKVLEIKPGDPEALEDIRKLQGTH